MKHVRNWNSDLRFDPFRCDRNGAAAKACARLESGSRAPACTQRYAGESAAGTLNRAVLTSGRPGLDVASRVATGYTRLVAKLIQPGVATSERKRLQTPRQQNLPKKAVLPAVARERVLA